MEPVTYIVLAAGMGKRLGGDLAKVLVKSAGKPLIQRVLESLAGAPSGNVVVVVGHQKDAVIATVSEIQRTDPALAALSIKFAPQEQQRGTGDAVRAALPCINGFRGTVVILYGDMPLLTNNTISLLLETHHRGKNTLSLVTTHATELSDFGRVIRDSSGHVEKIVEARDCTPEQARSGEMNCGIYAVDSAFLVPAVNELTNDNAQKEYYLTDIVGRAVREGQKVEAVFQREWQQFLGVNTTLDLANVEAEFGRKTIQAHIKAGVRFTNTDGVVIEPSVIIERGATIGPNTQLLGQTRVASGAVIEGTALVRDSVIGRNAVIKLGSYIERATIGDSVSVGPFAHLREGTELAAGAKIGNFVETKKASIGAGAKVPHLSYIGDASVGENTNIGAGTITCNYDGYTKSRTEIGSNVFIGSDSILVAPLTIGDGSLVAAGSTITKHVEADSLAIARAPQESRPGWAKRRSARAQQRK